MEKIIKNIILLLLPVVYIVSGCADSVNAPDNMPPMIELYRPAKGDTVIWGKKEVAYSASDDQKVTKIELWVNGKKDSTFISNPDGTVPPVYWLIDSSMVDTRASIYLVAFDEAGHSAQSNASTGIYVSENTQPPAAPKNLVVKKLSSTAVNLSWDDSSSNESEFQIWRKEEQGGTYTQIQSLPKNSVSTNDYDLKPSVVYYYKVLAKNKYGSAFSNEANTLGAALLPVYNLNAVAKGTSDVQLTWVDNVTTELGFVIQRKVSSAYSFNEIARVLPNTTQFEDTVGLSTGGTYTYRVAAIYQSGFSEWSNEKTVTTLSQNFLPPSSLTASLQANGSKIYLTWNNNTIPNGTRIERKTGQNGTYSEIGRVDYSTSNYTDNDISESVTYYYRVRGALYSGDFTGYSNEVSVSVPVLPPAAPSNLALTKISSTIYNLKWTDNSNNEDGFEIWRKDGDGPSADYKMVATVAKNSTSTNDQVPADNITYYYKIRAFRGADKSDFSNIINSTGGSGNLPRPTNVTASSNKTSVALSWNYPSSPSNILGYEIQRKVSWGEYSQIAMVLPSVKQYTDTNNLTSSLIYVYRIRAITSTEQSDWSDEVTVTIPASSLGKKKK